MTIGIKLVFTWVAVLLFTLMCGIATVSSKWNRLLAQVFFLELVLSIVGAVAWMWFVL